MKLLPIGNCPYCDREQKKYAVWAGSDEMFAEYKKQHEAGHPEFERKPMTIQQEEWEIEFDKEFGTNLWKEVTYKIKAPLRSWDVCVEDVKDFIRSQRKQVKEEVIEEIKKKITLLSKDIKNNGSMESTVAGEMIFIFMGIVTNALKKYEK